MVMAHTLHVDRPSECGRCRKDTWMALARQMDQWEVYDELIERGGRPDSLTLDPDGTAHVSYFDLDHRSILLDLRGL